MSRYPLRNPVDGVEEAGDIPPGQATIEVSDGTDNFAAGDVVIVGNDGSEVFTAVLGNKNDAQTSDGNDGALANVSGSVSGGSTLGGLL